MRIALFTETYLPYISAVVTHIKLLKEGLEKLGHQVLIVTADARARHHYVKDGVLFCPAKTIKRIYNSGLAAPYSHRRIKLIREFQPDIIHIHTEFGVGLSAIHIAKTLRVPLVYTLHTMYDEYIYYIAPRHLVPMMTKISHRYFRLFAKHAALITGPSQKCNEYIQRDCKLNRNVNVIPNPVELDKFKPENISEEHKRAFHQKYGTQEDEMLICFCGRIGREKSVDVLLDYWAETITPADKMKLIIFGDGPCRPELEEQAARLGIANMVIFTGAVPNNELPPYYAGCDLYVTASLSDTNSISMLEAMATGLPVVQRYDKLNEGQVKNGVNGFIFYNAAEMADVFRSYRAKSNEEKARMQASVRHSVEQAGSVNLAKHLLAVYEQAVNQVR